MGIQKVIVEEKDVKCICASSHWLEVWQQRVEKGEDEVKDGGELGEESLDSWFVLMCTWALSKQMVILANYPFSSPMQY